MSSYFWVITADLEAQGQPESHQFRPDIVAGEHFTGIGLYGI